ncbi:NAD(P)H-hydrate dehydratase [Thermospira aquatica]|uniref:ADP-dependent (S)-NAD(P)H-hydrate dehydratase n=1 Tax=Thermospira aquatica TaxID=2828656 RepID=A0AAX3BGC1_9SPIR|nr:NAD(P)H-hydrate dehydratase [Thermospira aquatica]URA11064.1 NAD(P)H-hydrate dehydratase [Thermospira aquatica]
MWICSFEEKIRREKQLWEKGVTTPFFRAEEKGGSIAREILSVSSSKGKIVLWCTPDLWNMSALVCARLLNAAGKEIVLGVFPNNGDIPREWRSSLRLLRKQGIKDIFFLDKASLRKRFVEACKGAEMLVGFFVGGWNKRKEYTSLLEWALRCFPLLIGIEVPLGYPESVIPTHEVWSLDFFVEDILDLPYRPWVEKRKLLSSFLLSSFYEEACAHSFVSTPSEVAFLVKQRPLEGHKGSFGRLLVIGGSEVYPGAMILAGRAALQSGCGLVTVSSDTRLAIDEPQLTYLPFTQDRALSILEAYLQRLSTSAILVGNGWGDDPSHGELLRFLLTQPYVKRLIIDADGLNLLARSPLLWDTLKKQQQQQPKEIILTPHVGEMVRLLRISSDDFRQKRKMYTLQLAQELQAVIVQKDATTLIVTPDGEVWYSLYGNTALSKGGSGDILAGLIGGLVASGYTTKDAALVGCFLLGRAAELWTQTYPPESATPSGILSFIAEAWKELYERKKLVQNLF